MVKCYLGKFPYVELSLTSLFVLPLKIKLIKQTTLYCNNDLLVLYCIYETRNNVRKNAYKIHKKFSIYMYIRVP